MPASNVRAQGSGKFVASNSGKKSEVLYFLAPRQPDFVNSIVQIMEDDGPRPMRNMRPAQNSECQKLSFLGYCHQKQRTGADKFQSDHHGQYEARGRQSRDEVGRVHAHNSAYPKLYDELDNRRTTAKPSMRMDHRSSYHREKTNQPLCCRCLRLKNREAHHQVKRYKSPNKRFRSYKMKSRITKPKQRFTRKYQSRSRNIKPKFNLNKGCHYRVPVETKSVSTYDDDYAEDNMPGTSKKLESNHKSQEDPKELKHEGSAISIPDPPKSEHSQNPGTSAPSLSSYNSYLSMDHEPMVD